MGPIKTLNGVLALSILLLAYARERQKPDAVRMAELQVLVWALGLASRWLFEAWLGSATIGGVIVVNIIMDLALLYATALQIDRFGRQRWLTVFFYLVMAQVLLHGAAIFSDMWTVEIRNRYRAGLNVTYWLQLAAIAWPRRQT